MQQQQLIQIAIAEDQELIRKSLKIVLDIEPDFSVVGLAENGKEALALCEETKPDIVLMDINMPIMDGVEATRILKDRWPDVKVIILTTFQEVNYVLDALNSGAEGYLLKAIDPKDLASGIRHVYRGETLIPQEMAKQIFSSPLTGKPPSGREPKATDYGLSERELQVLKCLSDGLSNREIAEKLYLSEGTVRNYISSTYSKMEVHNRASAARKALDEKLF